MLTIMLMITLLTLKETVEDMLTIMLMITLLTLLKKQ